MTRPISLDIDEDLVAEARKALGTIGVEATIEAALHAAIRTGRRQRLLRRLSDPDSLDDAALAGVRRSWP